MELDEVISRATKDLMVTNRNLEIAKRRNAPERDIENLEKKVEYRKAIVDIIAEFMTNDIKMAMDNEKVAALCAEYAVVNRKYARLVGIVEDMRPCRCCRNFTSDSVTQECHECLDAIESYRPGFILDEGKEEQ